MFAFRPHYPHEIGNAQFQLIWKMILQVRKQVSRCGNVKYIPSVCAHGMGTILNRDMRGSTHRELGRHVRDVQCDKCHSIVCPRNLRRRDVCAIYSET